MAVGIIAKNSILSKRRIYTLRQGCLLNFYLDRSSSKTKKLKVAPRFLAKKKMSYFAGYIAKEIVKEEVVTENFDERRDSTNSIDAWISDDICY